MYLHRTSVSSIGMIRWISLLTPGGTSLWSPLPTGALRTTTSGTWLYSVWVDVCTQMYYTYLRMYIYVSDWHISGDVGRRSVTGWNSVLGRRSRVRGSIVGPFSHVAILLSCVVSSQFKYMYLQYAYIFLTGCNFHDICEPAHVC